MALVGGVLGAVLARGIIDAVVALMPAYTLPSETEIVLSVPVLLFAFAHLRDRRACWPALAPAWRASRADVAEVMKEGGRSVSAGRDRLRRALIVVEFALALTLLAGGGMAVHALPAHDERRPRLPCRAARSRSRCRSRAASFSTAGEIEAFYRTLLERTQALPGVASVSVSTGMPVDGASFGTGFEIVGRPARLAAERRQHGDAGLLPHLRHRHGPRPAADRRRSRRQHARRHRQPGVRQAIPAGRRSDRPARHVRAVRGRHRAASRPGRRGRSSAIQADVVNDGPGREAQPEIQVSFWQIPWPRAILAVKTTGPASDITASVGDGGPRHRSDAAADQRPHHRADAQRVDRRRIGSTRCSSPGSRSWRWRSPRSASTA